MYVKSDIGIGCMVRYLYWQNDKINGEYCFNLNYTMHSTSLINNVAQCNACTCDHTIWFWNCSDSVFVFHFISAFHFMNLLQKAGRCFLSSITANTFTGLDLYMSNTAGAL